jgi:hypothetical protein
MALQLAFLVFLGFALAVFACMAPHAHAATPSAPPASGAGGPPPGPPPEAIAACKGKAEGTAVTFAGRNGESFKGVCQLTNGVLAARPGGGAGGPPPAR